MSNSRIKMSLRNVIIMYTVTKSNHINYRGVLISKYSNVNIQVLRVTLKISKENSTERMDKKVV